MIEQRIFSDCELEMLYSTLEEVNYEVEESGQQRGTIVKLITSDGELIQIRCG